MNSFSAPAALAALALLVGACSTPHVATPVSAIPSIASLEELMEVQEAAADPQFAKLGQATFAEAELADLARVGERLQATGLKTKDFSRGPRFDALATELHDHAKALEAAAKAKDVEAARKALGEVKATCDACHSEFR